MRVEQRQVSATYSELAVDLGCPQLQLPARRGRGEILMLDSAVISYHIIPEVSTAAVLLRSDQAWHCGVCLRTC